MPTQRTHQHLSDIKNKYDSIHETIEIHELDNIITQTHDALFNDLQQIVHYDQNTPPTESFIQQIYNTLVAKRTKQEAKITQLTNEITFITSQKTSKETSLGTTTNWLTKRLIDAQQELKDKNDDLKTKNREKISLEAEIQADTQEKLNKEKLKKQEKDPTEKAKLDTEIQDLFNNIKTKKIEVENKKFDIQILWQEISDLKREIPDIERKIEALEQAIENFKNQIQDLTDKKTEAENRKIKLKEMEDEYNKLINNGSNIFETSKILPKHTISIGTTWSYNTRPILIKPTVAVPTGTKFEIYDGDNKAYTWGDLKKVATADGTQVDIQWLSINTTTGAITWTNNIQIKNTQTGEKITNLPISISIDIQAGFDITGKLWSSLRTQSVHMVNRKKLEITINASTASLTTRYDTINTHSGNNITNTLNALHTSKLPEITRKVIEKVCEDTNKTEFDKLTPGEKDALYANITAILGTYVPNQADLRSLYRTLQTSKPFTGTQAEFETFLLQDLHTKAEQGIQKIMEDRLEQNLSTIPGKTRTGIQGIFTSFLTTNNRNVSSTTLLRYYDAINVSTGNAINNHLDVAYLNNYRQTVKDLIFEVCKGANEAQFNALSNDEKEEVYRQIAAILGTYEINDTDFRTQFRERITKEPFNGTQAEYQTHLMTNLDNKAKDELKKIMTERLDQDFTMAGRTAKAKIAMQGSFLDYINTLSTLNRQTNRLREVDAYDNAGPNPGVIRRTLQESYDNNLNKLEREAIFAALKKLDGPKFDQLTDDQKEELYQRLRGLYRDRTGVPNRLIPRTLGLNDINDYTTFTNWFTEDTHPGSQQPNTRNSTAYRNYIHNNLETELINFFNYKLNNVFADDLEANMYLKAELTNYLTEIKNRKIDNNTHADIDAGISDSVMDSPKKWFQRQDLDYMRFFKGSQTSVKGEVNINTNQTPEAKNNPEPYKYSMDVSVSSGNAINATITLADGEKMTLKSKEPNAMIKRILRATTIPYGKVRCHMAYNLLKSMVKIANDNNFSLEYKSVKRYINPGTGMAIHRPVTTKIKLKDDKISVELRDDNTNYNTAGWFRRISVTEFSEQNFINSNEFDSTTDNRSLRRGIEVMAHEFSAAMNIANRHYRQATERRRGWLVKWEMRTTLPTNFFLSPIKSIRGRFGEKMKFDFDPISVAGKNGTTAQIAFQGGKFYIQVGDKVYKNNNLGTLLRTREWGERIFDGMERDMCQAVYTKLIQELRGNRRIKSSSFGVKDTMKWGMYILDSDGDFCYLTQEEVDNNGGNLIRSAFMKPDDYGVVNHPPASRRKLSDEETKEVLKNPLIMARMIRAMSNRLRW